MTEQQNEVIFKAFTLNSENCLYITETWDHYTLSGRSNILLVIYKVSGNDEQIIKFSKKCYMIFYIIFHAE